MPCPECEARRKKLRDAIMHGKMAEAVGLTVEGLREMIGLNADAPAIVAEPAEAETAPAPKAAKVK